MKAADCGAAFIGLIFASSPRKITLDQAQDIIQAVRQIQRPPSIEPPCTDTQRHDYHRAKQALFEKARKPLIVGVFGDDSPDYIARVAIDLKLDLVQLHGNDIDTQVCAALPIPVIRSFNVDATSDINEVARAILEPNLHSLALLDTRVSGAKQQGGHGKLIDVAVAHRILERVESLCHGIESPGVIIAGGLNPANVGDVVSELNPWAIDVSSGVETSGTKDLDKIEQFIERAKSC